MESTFEKRDLEGAFEEQALEQTLWLELTLERTLGLELTLEGLTSQRTGGLNGERLMGWFWLGAGHSPETGGSPPSSIIPWEVHGAMVVGLVPEQRVEHHVVQRHTHREPADLPCILHQREISSGQGGEPSSGFHSRRGENRKTKTFKNRKRTRGKNSDAHSLFRSCILSRCAPSEETRRTINILLMT